MDKKTNMAETSRIIDEAVKVLKAGGTILYPTDTIWGIGCDATNKEAVEKVFAIKERPDSKSLITLVADTDMLYKYVEEVPQIALELIEVNDRPMTIIYPKGAGLAENVIAEDGSVGIRIPMSKFCVQLMKRLHRPIVSTSANISGTASPKNYGEIAPEILKAVDYIVSPEMEEQSTHTASQIIKVGTGSEIEIIRP